MKSQTLSTIKRGFTLIELIVVIAILAVLAGAAYPVIMSMTTRAQESAAKTTTTNLVQGIANFKGDYNGFMPIDSDAIRPDRNNQILIVTEAGKDGKLISVLTNRENKRDKNIINTNQDVYFRSDLQEQKRDGLFADSAGVSLYDPWGKPYYVIISDEPEGAIDPFTNKETGKPCLVFSTGSDMEGLPDIFDTTTRRRTTSSKASSRTSKSSSRAAAAKRAAAADAEEELAEAIEDNIYSWKTAK